MSQEPTTQPVSLSWHWWWGLFGMLGFPAILLGVLKAWQLQSLSGSPPSAFVVYASLRWDVVGLLLWGAVLSGLWQRESRWIQGFATLLLVLSGVFLFGVTVWEFLCFWNLGSLGDFTMMMWLWNQWMDQGWTHTFPELPRFLRWFWLAPFCLSLPLLLGLAKRENNELEASSKNSPKSGLSWLWPTALLILLIPPVGGTLPYPQLTQSSLWGSLFQQSVSPWWRAPLLKTTQEPAFSAQSLQLINKTTVPRYNIIVVAMDATRLKSTTLSQPSLQTTPFLAKLAKHSTTTQQMVAFTPHRLKSWVSLLCGMYPSMDGRDWSTFAGALPARCLPHLLEKQGYQTALFQPNSVFADARESFIYNLGFSSLIGSEDLDAAGFSKSTHNAYEDRIALKPVLDWLDKASAQTSPFFLTWTTQSARQGRKLPAGWPSQNLQASTDKAHRYRNALFYQDRMLAQFYEELKRRKLLSSTILLVVGLRGASVSTGGSEETELAASNMRVPFLMHHPAKSWKPKIVVGPRHHIDIVPTLIETLGFSLIGGRLPGVSLTKSVPSTRPLFLSCRSGLRCLSSIHGNEQLFFRGYRHPSYFVKNQQQVKGTSGLSKRKASLVDVRKLLVWRELVNEVYRKDVVLRRKVSSTQFEPKAKLPSGARLGSYVRVVGATLDTSKATPGGALGLTTIYQALRRIPRQYRLFFHLGRKSETSFINFDHPLVGGSHPMRRWRAGEYVQDEYKVRIPSSYKQGDIVQVFLGMWSKRQGRVSIVGDSKTIRKDAKNRLIVAEFVVP